jgi:hypothetical protein
MTTLLGTTGMKAPMARWTVMTPGNSTRKALCGHVVKRGEMTLAVTQLFMNRQARRDSEREGIVVGASSLVCLYEPGYGNYNSTQSEDVDLKPKCVSIHLTQNPTLPISNPASITPRLLFQHTLNLRCHSAEEPFLTLLLRTGLSLKQHSASTNQYYGHLVVPSSSGH